MLIRALRLILISSILALVLAASAWTQPPGDAGGPPRPPPARKIPGINADDKFIHACVDCHVNHTEMKMDVRLSTLMKQWNEKVDEKLLAKARASSPEGLVLKGRHPSIGDSFKNIPGDCLKCHGSTSKMAPPFAKLMHSIHLTGGDENHFMTMFQGECTHCHKLSAKTGAWSISNGPEK